MQNGMDDGRGSTRPGSTSRPGSDWLVWRAASSASAIHLAPWPAQSSQPGPVVSRLQPPALRQHIHMPAWMAGSTKLEYRDRWLAPQPRRAPRPQLHGHGCPRSSRIRKRHDRPSYLSSCPRSLRLCATPKSLNLREHPRCLRCARLSVAGGALTAASMLKRFSRPSSLASSHLVSLTARAGPGAGFRLSVAFLTLPACC